MLTSSWGKVVLLYLVVAAASDVKKRGYVVCEGEGQGQEAALA